MNEIISIPNAPKTFKALRSLGYNINSSVADIVDNAITDRVAANKVQVIFKINKDHEIIARIIDDGKGMSQVELQEAMRIGAEASYDAADLGKFGMGMKTASLSHCNVLTVISKRSNEELSGYCWNIGHVKRTEKWTLLALSDKEINDKLNTEGIQINDSGTVVLWDDLFQINNDYNRIVTQKLADNYLFRKTEELKIHLRMVFHRFLERGNGLARDVEIFVNSEKLIPWDPFCRSEKNTIRIDLKPSLSMVYIQNDKEPVRIDAYILPTKEGFSSEKAWKEARGLLSWNDGQGYYIYRANRLIRFGGWHGTKAKDEHDKLARLSIDIHPELDDEFRITVNKNRVELPELLFQLLKNEINPVAVKKAQVQYRREPEKNNVINKVRGNKKIQEVTKLLIDSSNIQTKESDLSKGEVEVQNQSGTWLSNKLNEFLKYGNEDDYEIISDHIENGHLWKIVCDPYNKFKVIINSSHPFYSLIYKKNVNQQVTEAIDVLVFSLAFGELYNKNDQNSHLFDTFKAVLSQALEKLVKEKII